MKRSSVLRRVLLGGVLVALVVTGLEGLASITSLARAVRALRPPPENFRQAAYDSLVGWVGLPNLAIRDNYGAGASLTTNADGMRIHRPVTAALAPGERRIVCSGDSFTFGSGVGDADTFCARLEAALPGVRTLNMAQGGYGNDQAYLRYQRDGGRYPHQLHVFAFIFHDFERMTMTRFTGYPKPVLRLRDGRLVPENVPVPEWKGWSRRTDALALLPRSRLMQLVREQVDLSDSARMARTDAQVWGPVEAVFRDLDRLGKERRSELVLVYLPTVSDLTDDAYRHRRRKLVELTGRLGLTLIDLTDEMQQVPADSVDWLYITPNGLPVDGHSGHYTPKGHEWVAQRLAARLRAIPAVDSALTADPSPVAIGPARGEP